MEEHPYVLNHNLNRIARCTVYPHNQIRHKGKSLELTYILLKLILLLPNEVILNRNNDITVINKPEYIGKAYDIRLYFLLNREVGYTAIDKHADKDYYSHIEVNKHYGYGKSIQDKQQIILVGIQVINITQIIKIIIDAVFSRLAALK